MQNPSHNPHVTKFMERKKPPPYNPPRKVVKKSEDDTNLVYAKPELAQSVLLCARRRNHATPTRGAHATPTRSARAPSQCADTRARRKNKNMLMALKYELPEATKPKILGRVKSDITDGHENLYERSYY